MREEVKFYRENEKKVNKIYFYLLSGGVALGVLLVIAVLLFTPHTEKFTFWYALYLLGVGGILAAVPFYLIRYQPDSRITKYILVGDTIGLVVFINILLAGISDSNFMNFFWALVFSSLYFNKRTTIFATGASIISYLLITVLIPEVRPAGYQSYQAAVAVRIFYLLLVGVGCTYITNLATNLLQRISHQERVNKEAFQDIRNLLKGVAISATTLTSATEELRSYTEETNASLQATGDIVKSLADDATKTREGMTKTQQLLNTLSERADEHQDLTVQTLKLTENIVSTAAQGSENVAAVEREINQVVSQFDTTLETIEELNLDSQNIGEIVQTISNIAEQTKMLSMNASIEAARAGEYGRGFAVVAQKISKLSIQTQETLKQIETIIKKFLPKLETTVTSSKETAVTFERGMRNVNQINETFTRIVQTLQEGLPLLQSVGGFLNSQADIIKEINSEVTNAYDFTMASEEGMGNLNDIFREITAIAQTLTISTQQLGALAQTLTTQAKTKFSDTELEEELVDTMAAAQEQPAVSVAGEKDTEFEDEFDFDDFDLDALEESLEISLSEK